jgi:hypothetical protein
VAMIFHFCGHFTPSTITTFEKSILKVVAGLSSLEAFITVNPQNTNNIIK